MQTVYLFIVGWSVMSSALYSVYISNLYNVKEIGKKLIISGCLLCR